ncbi:unnamed protein product [Lactuca saligna]|uniref:Uncharacterized protein n=1 Tax=Lactuca saligna TaxID=75948 RepID=A0AA35YT98_LACSI|nr:unnamed protein product [Lactuca saligna]
MAHESSFLVLVHIFILLWHFGTYKVSSKPKVPCYFIFGDSLVDNGNNNELYSKWKANYRPYGVDFPKGDTGRFCNGRTTADIIGQFLGFNDFIPPYATATDEEISTGVNYASAGCGIREETGSHNGGRFSLDMQLVNHKAVISRLSRLQQNISTLKECMYLVNIGSNDFVNNYFLPDHYNTSRLYSLKKYTEVLMKQYSKQLRTLYKMGARKVALFALTQIGCTPLATSKFGTDGKPCVKEINKAAMLFNHKFKPLVEKLNTDNEDALFTFINITSILYPQGDRAMRTPPCCKLDGEWACKAGSIPCPFRIFHIYYDALHPSEISNIAMATRAYHAIHPADAYPYDIYHLVRVHN